MEKAAETCGYSQSVLAIQTIYHTQIISSHGPHQYHLHPQQASLTYDTRVRFVTRKGAFAIYSQLTAVALGIELDGINDGTLSC